MVCGNKISTHNESKQTNIYIERGKLVVPKQNNLSNNQV